MASTRRPSTATLTFALVFTCAVFIFLRALSGAGYVDSQSKSLLSSTLSYTHLVSDNAASKPQGSVDFKQHWKHFKGTYLSCPSASTNGTADAATTEGEIKPDDGGKEEQPGTLAEQDAAGQDTICIKERLKDVIGLFKYNGPSFAQEDRAFRFSFDGIPSSYFKNDESSSSDLQH